MKKAVVKAYAKINLILDVLGKRPDGYHEVEMIMQAISLYDRITIKPGNGISITTNHPLIPLDERNLAYQAAEVLIKEYPDIPGVEINIEKNIPMEAGLAGGSTDAAAVLIGMNAMFSLKMDNIELLERGAQLGSDVPFCILGATALAKGRGEIIEEVAQCPKLWVVLVKPNFGVKTKEVYQNLMLSSISSHPDLAGYLDALQVGDVPYLLNKIANVLEYSTFKLYPQVKELKEALKALGAKSLLMSGSGPTIYALFASQEAADTFASDVRKGCTYQVWVAHTLNKEILNERVEIS
ncbi:MAG: hypothetical protein VR72_01770 [Clostridiaceae bacterium BRH_c20a]|nr:MAG: hypothetical protein VR72_01770 [Clostridiaceae bacterium BRH_c20a]